LRGSEKIVIVENMEAMTRRKSVRKTARRGRRRKHHHWQVNIFYHDGEKFARVYIDRERAERFAARQKKSPIVKAARIIELV
jgi:hypothetical protein